MLLLNIRLIISSREGEILLLFLIGGVIWKFASASRNVTLSKTYFIKEK